LNFKILESDQEIKNLSILITRLKKENEGNVDTIEKLRREIMSLNKFKQDSVENDENTKRDSVKKMQNNLMNLAIIISKIKSKYQQEIHNLKSELESVHLAYESDMSLNIKSLKTNIEGLEFSIQEEKLKNKKILLNIENKDNEFSVVQKDVDKLREMYENKIKLLNSKINTDEENILDFKNQIKQKTEVSSYKLATE
jgi:hypothetical protein